MSKILTASGDVMNIASFPNVLQSILKDKPYIYDAVSNKALLIVDRYLFPALYSMLMSEKQTLQTLFFSELEADKNKNIMEEIYNNNSEEIIDLYIRKPNDAKQSLTISGEILANVKHDISYNDKTGDLFRLKSEYDHSYILNDRMLYESSKLFTKALSAIKAFYESHNEVIMPVSLLQNHIVSLESDTEFARSSGTWSAYGVELFALSNTLTPFRSLFIISKNYDILQSFDVFVDSNITPLYFKLNLKYLTDLIRLRDSFINNVLLNYNRLFNSDEYKLIRFDYGSELSEFEIFMSMFVLGFLSKLINLDGTDIHSLLIPGIYVKCNVESIHDGSLLFIDGGEIIIPIHKKLFNYIVNKLLNVRDDITIKLYDINDNFIKNINSFYKLLDDSNIIDDDNDDEFNNKRLTTNNISVGKATSFVASIMNHYMNNISDDVRFSTFIADIMNKIDGMSDMINNVINNSRYKVNMKFIRNFYESLLGGVENYDKFVNEFYPELPTNFYTDILYDLIVE